jgi:hypothetical protein
VAKGTPGRRAACTIHAVTARDRRLLVGLALLSSVLLLGEAAGVLAPALLYSAPLLLLSLPLLAGRYVGEERIARLASVVRERRAGPAPRRAASSTAARAVPSVPRGGRLIASSLAVRPPPAPAFSS